MEELTIINSYEAYNNIKSGEQIVVSEYVLGRLKKIIGGLYKQPYIIPTFEGTVLLEFGIAGIPDYLTFELTDKGISIYMNWLKESPHDLLGELTIYEKHTTYEALIDTKFINDSLVDFGIVNIKK